MTGKQSALNEEDIRQFIKGEAGARALVAHRLCRHMDRAPLTDADRVRAYEILRLMARDAAEEVRRTLAVTLRASSLVPRDVANRLARDIQSIAIPILNFSPSFSDDDLAEIVRTCEPWRQAAVARRPTVSEPVTRVIVEAAAPEAVEAACRNPGAEFSEAGLSAAVIRFDRSRPVLSAIAAREALPAAITEKLISLVSGELKDRLIKGHAVTPMTAETIAIGTRERATLDLVEQARRASDIPGFVAHLRQGQRLTPSLLLRALAHGHMEFFEWGLAELSGVPHHRTWLMVHDAGELGLKAIYERAGLPGKLLPAFRAAVDAYHATEMDGGTDDLRRFQRRMLERFLSQPTPTARDDVDYLLDKMDQLSAPQDVALPLADRAANAA
jgi:uncharacterized protein (DUF2336 family)